MTAITVKIYEKQKFLFVSKDSLSGDLAAQLLKRVMKLNSILRINTVRMFMMVSWKKFTTGKKFINWADIIILMMKISAPYADRLRKKKD